MKKFNGGFSFLIIVIVLAIVGAGVYFYLKSNNSSTSIETSFVTLNFPAKYVALQNPSRKELDKNGCLMGARGFLCAKQESDGSGIIFSGDDISTNVPRGDYQGLRTDESRNNLLKDMAANLKSAAKPGESMTDEYTTIQTFPTLILNSELRNSKGELRTMRQIFIVKNTQVYSFSFAANNSMFKQLWPNIKSSIITATFTQ